MCTAEALAEALLQNGKPTIECAGLIPDSDQIFKIEW